jgi:glycosyltransferase involved in cell wall biosynthesis
MAARNEKENICSKLDSCLRLDYRKEKMEIIVGSDGSTDGTVEHLIRKYGNKIRVLNLPRMGKALVNNIMVEAAKGDIIVDTSSSGYFEEGFLKVLLKHFANSNVGCVTGESHFKNRASSSISCAEATYFDFEWKLRNAESKLGLLCVGNGGVLAWRKSLYAPIYRSSDVDNMVPLLIVKQGYRVVHEPLARTLGEKTPDTDKQQLKGRIRQVSRSQQDIYRAGQLLNPFKNTRFSYVLFSRRLLRWWLPFLLCTLFSVNAFLLYSFFYKSIFISQCIFYSLGTIGFLFRNGLARYHKILLIPANIINVCIAFAVGTFNAVRRKEIITW